MSYDLVIFEKSKTPTGQPDFLNWYNKKMECDDEQDISSAPKSFPFITEYISAHEWFICPK